MFLRWLLRRLKMEEERRRDMRKTREKRKKEFIFVFFILKHYTCGIFIYF